MNKFYAVFDIDRVQEAIVIVGVFTNADDATAYTKGREINAVQHLEMKTILDILIQDRLQLAADKIAKLIG
jgi:hypothetical protein